MPRSKLKPSVSHQGEVDAPPHWSGSRAARLHASRETVMLPLRGASACAAACCLRADVCGTPSGGLHLDVRWCSNPPPAVAYLIDYTTSRRNGPTPEIMRRSVHREHWLPRGPHFRVAGAVRYRRAVAAC